MMTSRFFRPVGPVALSVAMLAVGACDAGRSGTASGVECSKDKVPALVDARPDDRMNSLFNSYGDHSTPLEWSGADGGRSIALPDGRVLWTYGDSFLGPVNPDKTRPKDAKLVTNSFIVQDGDHLSTIIPPSTPPNAAIPVPGEDPHQRWYWPGPGTAANGRVEILLSQVRRNEGGGAFGFEGEGQVLAQLKLSLPDLHVLDVKRLPNTVPGLSWTGDILRDGEYTYIYGVQEVKDAYSKMKIARVKGPSLTAPWEYFTGSGWSTTEADSQPVLDTVGAAYGVTKIGAFYAAVMVIPYDPEVYAYFSCSPTGPFTNKTSLYRTPEPGTVGSDNGKNTYTYNVDVHGHLGTPDKLVFSYNVNGSFADNYEDVTSYRPHYIDVTVKL